MDTSADSWRDSSGDSWMDSSGGSWLDIWGGLGGNRPRGLEPWARQKNIRAPSNLQAVGQKIQREGRDPSLRSRDKKYQTTTASKWKRKQVLETRNYRALQTQTNHLKKRLREYRNNSSNNKKPPDDVVSGSGSKSSAVAECATAATIQFNEVHIYIYTCMYICIYMWQVPLGVMRSACSAKANKSIFCYSYKTRHPVGCT